MRTLLLLLLLIFSASVARAAEREVLIYYANESAPAGQELANVATITSWLRASDTERGRKFAESLKKDGPYFSAVVDDEIAEIARYHTSDRTAVVVFTNRSVREGYFLVGDRPGDELQRVQIEPLSSDNYLEAANPLASPGVLQRAFEAAAEAFPPAAHRFVLVAKSHGNRDRPLAVRLGRRHEETTQEQLTAALLGESVELPPIQLGTSRSDFFGVLEGVGDRLGMRFSLVFLESCQGDFSLNEAQALPTNVEVACASGDRYLEYRTLDYESLFKRVAEGELLSVAMDRFLSERYLVLRHDRAFLRWSSWLWLTTPFGVWLALRGREFCRQPREHLSRLSVQSLAGFVHDWILLLLASSYALAVMVPRPGIWLRDIEWTSAALGNYGPTQLMLALLLLVSATGVDLKRLSAAFLQPRALLAALAVKSILPAALTFAVASVVAAWGADELAPLVLGLGLVAAMPCASSAPAWTQTAEGNVALTLGTLVLSMVLGPVLGSLWLPEAARLLGATSVGRISISAGLAQYFVIWVLAPSALGIGLRSLLPEKRYGAIKPVLRLVNVVLLMTLIYAFASASLGGALSTGEGGLLAWAFGLATGACLALFVAGWGIGRMLRLDTASLTGFTYSVGMHNNGVAMLLGAGVLSLEPDSPAFLPVIAYALTQHVVAAAADVFFQWRLERFERSP